MKRLLPLAVVTTAVLALPGCASLASSSAEAGQPSASASASAAATSGVCTASACIVDDAQRSLLGQAAKDNSVSTKAVCKKSTVKRNAGDTYTVTCTVTYSDGMVARGYANLIPAQDKFTFEPVSILSYGNGS